MKLLFIIRDVRGWAGTERVTSLIANALAESHTVEVLSLSQKPTTQVNKEHTQERTQTLTKKLIAQLPQGYSYQPSIEISYIPARNDMLNLCITTIKIAHHLAKGNYDVVVLSGVGEIKFLLGAIHFCRSKFVAWEHFNAAHTHKRVNRKVAARLCDAIVVLTKADADDWQRYLHPHGRIAYIPNPLAEMPALPSILSEKRVLALGRLEEQKRFDLLIEAFSLMHKECPDWHLRIRGSGSKEPVLRQRLQELELTSAVEILPPVTDVASEYREASIYALSSKFEGFPMTLVEAMSFGIPCVSFNCPNGPDEIIADGDDGFIVPYDDVPGFATAMIQLAEDPTLRHQMGQRARQHIQRFDLAHIQVLWEDLIDQLCQK